MGDLIGPAIPKHLMQKSQVDKQQEPEEDENAGSTGSAESAPAVCTDSKCTTAASPSPTGSKAHHSADSYAPPLPPGFKTRSEGDDSYAPPLPPGFKTRSGDDDSYAPPLPPADEDVIGPLPPSTKSEYSVVAEIEERSKAMKDKLTKNEDNVQKREEWMMELPPQLSRNSGIVNRSFKKNVQSHSEDRSVWTETPGQEKEKHEKLKKKKREEDKRAELARREKKIAKRIEKHNKKKRKESLMELHQKKAKKTKTEEKAERVAFDRDRDMNVKILSSAQKHKLMSNSGLLSSKFSQGHHQTFL